MFVTDDAALYEHALTLSNHGRARGETRQFYPVEIGFKYKMSNVQAALGCGQVERIDELIAGKRRVFTSYANALTDLPLRMNPEPAGTRNGFWMPTIVADQTADFDREHLLAAFQADNIDGRVFFWPLSSLPMFTPVHANKVSQSLPPRAMNLPSYHDLDEAGIARVVHCVRQAFGAAR
jgi:perosamine synthetase